MKNKKSGKKRMTEIHYFAGTFFLIAGFLQLTLIPRCNNSSIVAFNAIMYFLAAILMFV